jgi:hypothetical protein
MSHPANKPAANSLEWVVGAGCDGMIPGCCPVCDRPMDDSGCRFIGEEPGLIEGYPKVVFLCLVKTSIAP